MPKDAEDTETTGTLILHTIEIARRFVAQESISRIEPQQPRRYGDSDYLDHSTVLQLDGVTLPQLARRPFIRGLWRNASACEIICGDGLDDQAG